MDLLMPRCMLWQQQQNLELLSCRKRPNRYAAFLLWRTAASSRFTALGAPLIASVCALPFKIIPLPPPGALRMRIKRGFRDRT